MTDALCECGCGQPAPIATYTHLPRGWVAGRPKRFISGHNAKGRKKQNRISIEERGHETPCWIWQLSLTSAGYGQLTPSDTGVRELAHRFYWRQENGWLPRELHHVCGVPACVNPAHLEPVDDATHKRIHVASRTHCRRGHEYAVHGSKSGRRRCLACKRDARRARQRERAA